MYDPDTMLTQLPGYNTLVAAMMVAAGGVFLMLGWRIFKFLVVLNALILGAAGGMWVGTRIGHNMDIILAIAGGLILAAASWPLMTWAVSVMGALCGSVVGYSLWFYVGKIFTQSPQVTNLAWVGALIGLITLGLLAFIIFKAVVIIFTSVQGSVMLVCGVLALILRNLGPENQASFLSKFQTNSFLLPMLIIVPAILGGIFQQAKFGKHAGA